MNWRRIRKEQWEGFRDSVLTPWEAVRYADLNGLSLLIGALYLGAFVVLTVVLAFAGLAISAIFRELGIVDWVRYDSVHKNAPADWGDWTRWTVIGWSGLVIAWFIWMIASPIGREMESWSRAKDTLRRERIEAWEHRQAEARQRELAD